MARPTELRLALVMNGGVSLAVWMGGVVHEIALLVRASRGHGRPPADDPDRLVWDRWRQVCADARVTVTVDVVAGTSAGGLNGVLLATALARGGSLGMLRELWFTRAQLTEGMLLRPDGTGPCASVLDGGYFAGQVRDVVERIGAQDPPGEPAPGPADVTLFTTATALGTQVRTFTDAAGEPVVVADHRQLYRFRRSGSAQTFRPERIGRDGVDLAELFVPDRPDDFAGATATGRLSRAARASAGFPAAFEPVRSADDQVDLTPVLVTGGTKVSMMDGGVLDNAPFGPVLDEIARRPVDGGWKRVVAYVVPSGETAEPVPGDEGPDWVDTVLSAVGLRSEADVRDDLDRLTALQADADSSVRTADRLLASLLTGADVGRHTAAAEALLPDYRRSQVQGSLRDVAALWPESGGAAPAGDDDGGARGWLPGELDWSESGWSWGTAAAERSLRLLLRAADGGEPGADRDDALRTISERMAQARAVREVVEARIRAAGPVPPQDVATILDVIDNAVAQAHVGRVCGRLVADGARAYASTLPGDAPDPHEIVRRCLVAEVLTHALSSRRFERHTAFDFLRIGPDVTSPVVGALVPPDAAGPKPPGPWKLWGTQLGHFGAFGRERWRSQDWVWGRLDAAAHLVRAVELASGPVPDGTVSGLHLAVLGAEDVSAGDLRARTVPLARMTARRVLRELWTDDEGGRALVEGLLESVLRTLRFPGRHRAVTRNGNRLSLLLGRSVPHDLDDELTEKATRWFVTPRLREHAREAFEQWLAKTGEDVRA